MTFCCLLSATTLVLAGLLVSLSDADVFFHNPRGSNNRLNKAGAARANNDRLFDSQNNANGGYNVGDKDKKSNSEETQFNMHYFQSGKGHASSSGLTGKSLLTIEWTNQHGCGDRDLNCNIVLQYRCQDDTKHQTLDYHTMRNGRVTSTPKYNKKTYTDRSAKNKELRHASTSNSRGLHESWEWYDKCVKRNRIGINCAVKTKSGVCCVFPFIYKTKRYDSCTTVDNGNTLWCATTSNYDKDGKWENCKITQGSNTNPTNNNGLGNGGISCAVKISSGACCVFPFIYKKKRYGSCTTVDYGNTLWCATTSNYDKDGKWGICSFTQGSNDSPNLKDYDEERTGETFDPNPKNYDEQKTGGLFTADQNLNGQTNIYTRQNPNGARRGYECPEERDYYPYWHPTDWIDIAVLAYNQTMCNYYQRESSNVKTKEECLEYYNYNSKSDGFRHDSVYSNKIDCENNQGFWVSFSNYLEEYPKYQTEQECKAASSSQLHLIWAIPYRSEDIDNLKMTGDNVESLKRCLVALDPPACKKAPYTRTNHLGNARDVVPLRYTWVIPHFPSGHAQRCVLRIRYNISTGDYAPFNTFGDQNDDPDNGVNSPVQNNPKVEVGDVQLSLQLAINTAQFGRTFQDRSHLFKLLPRPKAVSDTDVIYNLNVRGKRGNIVQAFPAVEYDFIPKRMKITSASLVHIQWTGSNTNPGNFAGQGTAGTDRHNMVEMADPSVNYPLTSGKPLTMFTNAEIVWSSDKKTNTKQDLILSMASSGYCSSVSHCNALKAQNKALNDELNNAPASYRGMLLKFGPGEYYYMCTRNNNFSNRNQKGRLVVRPLVSD